MDLGLHGKIAAITGASKGIGPRMRRNAAARGGQCGDLRAGQRSARGRVSRDAENGHRSRGDGGPNA
jgi:NAD(P)-dependent dehydrogenase (short-subunit alcohol dehydrogenase family)